MSLHPQPARAREADDVADVVDEIVARCLESDGAELESSVESECRANPSLASNIRARIEALHVLGLVRADDAGIGARFPERLGEFRLLERLGVGGMGVVFRARQENLGRDVALKLIRPEQLYFPRARERFRRETEAIARLQHPGIVPIYAVGEDAGVPYYAMELVAGCTLEQLVGELRGRAPESLAGDDIERCLRALQPRWTESSAPRDSGAFNGSYVACVMRIVVQVGDALQHAHERGVLHRDVKPSNIVLGLDGRARLFDFGLAGLSDQTTRLTASHAELGSLLFMAPEQLRRDQSAIDHRADVYALGVTLYELLTLQVPYGERDAELTRRAILDGRPDSICTRNRAVPRELEVVCLHAMDRERARRYSDAAALCADLRNILEHRPIAARPPSAALRLRRWVQRHPTASASLGLGALALVGVPSGLYWQATAHARELDRSLAAVTAAQKLAESERTAAQVARGEATDQRNIARDEAHDAQEVNDFLVRMLTSVDPAVTHGRVPSVRQLLDMGGATVQYQLADQPDVQGRLYSAIAQAYMSLGDYTAAEPMLERALELLREHVGERTAPVADALYPLSILRAKVRRPDALAAAQLAVEIERELGPEARPKLARYLVGCARALQAEHRVGESVDMLREALAVQETLAGDQRELRAMIDNHLANALFEDRQYEQALAPARECVALRRAVARGPHPMITSSLDLIARALAHLGATGEALATYDELLVLARQMDGAENESCALYLGDRARLWLALDAAESAVEDLAEADALFQRTAEPDYAPAVRCAEELAAAQISAALWSDARETLERLLDRAAQEESAVSARRIGLECDAALCTEALGDVGGALRELDDASSAAAQCGEPQVVERVAIVHAQRARILAECGDLARARAELACVERREHIDAARWVRDALLIYADARVTLLEGRVEEARGLFEILAEIERGPDGARWVPTAARVYVAALSSDPARRGGESVAAPLAELERQLGCLHPELAAAHAALPAAK